MGFRFRQIWRLMTGGKVIRQLARYLTVCLLAVASVQAAADEASYVTDTQVEFSGRFGVDVGLDANDKKEYYYYLKLDHPISVLDKEDEITERNVTKIQLIIHGEVFTKPYKNKRITVKGSLFPGLLAHHHTKILMLVKKAEDMRLEEPH